MSTAPPAPRISFMGRWLRAAHLGVVGAGAGSGVLAISAVAVSGLDLSPVEATMLLHLSLLATLGGLPFTLADPCAELIASTPWSLAVDKALRAVVSSTAIAMAWLLQVALLPYLMAGGQGVSGAGLLVEVTPFLLVVLAATWRVPGPRSAGAGLGALLVLYLVCWWASGPLLLFAAPGEEAFAATRTRWLVLTAACALALGAVAALPAIRRRVRALRQPPGARHQDHRGRHSRHRHYGRSPAAPAGPTEVPAPPSSISQW